MKELFSYLIQGVVLGVSAGISPGPLTSLTISQTIKHNKKEGIKVALTPLITDAPIVLASIFLLSKAASTELFIGLISLIGSFFLIYLGIDCFSSNDLNIDSKNQIPKSILKGVLTNALSPNPYLFWLAIGAPIFHRSSNIESALIFILSFYISIVFSKVTLALLISKSPRTLVDKYYKTIMQFLGLSLILFAILFFKESIIYLI